LGDGTVIDRIPLRLTGIGSVRDDLDPTTLSNAQLERLLAACDPSLRAMSRCAARRA
jgi:hypothetical protein